MRAHNEISGIKADPDSSSSSPFSSSVDSSDVEVTCVQPAGLISDGPVTAARESQFYRENISDSPAVMLYDFCNAFRIVFMSGCGLF